MRCPENSFWTDHKVYRDLSSNKSLRKEMESILPVKDIVTIDFFGDINLNINFDEEWKKLMELQEMKNLRKMTKFVLENTTCKWTSHKLWFLVTISDASPDLIIRHHLYKFFQQLLYQNPQLGKFKLNNHGMTPKTAFQILSWSLNSYISDMERTKPSNE